MKKMVLSNDQLQELILESRMNRRMMRRAIVFGAQKGIKVNYFNPGKIGRGTKIKRPFFRGNEYLKGSRRINLFAGFGVGEGLALAGLAASIYGIYIAKTSTDQPRCQQVIRGKICRAFLLKHEFVEAMGERYMNSWCEKKHVTKRLLPNA